MTSSATRWSTDVTCVCARDWVVCVCQINCHALGLGNSSKFVVEVDVAFSNNTYSNIFSAWIFKLKILEIVSKEAKHIHFMNYMLPAYILLTWKGVMMHFCLYHFFKYVFINSWWFWLYNTFPDPLIFNLTFIMK